MLLQLDSQFRVTCDSSKQNFQLEQFCEITHKKTKEVRTDYIIVGYHGNSFKSVLNQYSKLALINDENLQTMNDVLDKLKEIERTIDRVVKRENITLEPKQEQE